MRKHQTKRWKKSKRARRHYRNRKKVIYTFEIDKSDYVKLKRLSQKTNIAIVKLIEMAILAMDA